MRFEAVGRTACGPSRQENEDCFCMGPFLEQSGYVEIAFSGTSSMFGTHGCIFAVADGMGGYEGGRAASEAALSAFQGAFYKVGNVNSGQNSSFILHCIHEAQESLTSHLRSLGLDQAGTTLAGIAFFPRSEAIVFHVGDSRVLRYSAGFLRQLTYDHTSYGESQKSNASSVLSVAPSRESTLLTRSMGLEGNCEPELLAIGWQEGDIFLVGTDGWFGSGKGLSREKVVEVAASNSCLSAMVAEQITEACAADGSDNATLLAVAIRSEESGP